MAKIRKTIMHATNDREIAFICLSVDAIKYDDDAGDRSLMLPAGKPIMLLPGHRLVLDQSGLHDEEELQ